ncbi:MAG: hypothetical protein AAF212_09845 [Verrucomicrobiota bacterium]
MIDGTAGRTAGLFEELAETQVFAFYGGVFPIASPRRYIKDLDSLKSAPIMWPGINNRYYWVLRLEKHI